MMVIVTMIKSVVVVVVAVVELDVDFVAVPSLERHVSKEK